MPRKVKTSVVLAFCQLAIECISIGFQLTKTGWPKQQEVIQGIAITWVDIMGGTLKSSIQGKVQIEETL